MYHSFYLSAGSPTLFGSDDDCGGGEQGADGRGGADDGEGDEGPPLIAAGHEYISKLIFSVAMEHSFTDLEILTVGPRRLNCPHKHTIQRHHNFVEVSSTLSMKTTRYLSLLIMGRKLVVVKVESETLVLVHAVYHTIDRFVHGHLSHTVGKHNIIHGPASKETESCR